MIKSFKSVFVLLSFVLMAFSCSKGDGVEDIYVVPYTEQYPKDIANIEKFLKTHKIEVTNNPGFIDDQDVKFTIVSSGDATSIWGSDPIVPQSSLLSKIVKSNGVDYKVYYLNLRAGVGDNISRVDSAFVSYRGEYIYEKKEEVVPATNPITYNTFITGKQFDQAQNPVWFSLNGVIQGWREIVPLFKTGTSTFNPSTGVSTFNDFGAGVMFIPSGLAYYYDSPGTIPQYTPLIFSFKLKALNYVDHDFDGIDSKDEDINGNGIYTDDDTDGDGRQNYLDQDDDGDGYLTKTERKIPTGGYYSFANIPDCSGNSPATGVKRHLDRNCH